MPNWVYCFLEVSGNTQDLLKFKEKATSKVDKIGRELPHPDVLAEFNFIPYPKKFADRDIRPPTSIERYKGKYKGYKRRVAGSDGYNSGGHEWCVDRWGSKWGICSADIESSSESHIEYSFECAWAPVFPVIKKMSKDFPNLTFEMRYEEEGPAFAGIVTYKKGKSVSHLPMEVEVTEEDGKIKTIQPGICRSSENDF